MPFDTTTVFPRCKKAKCAVGMLNCRLTRNSRKNNNNPYGNLLEVATSGKMETENFSQGEIFLKGKVERAAGDQRRICPANFISLAERRRRRR